MLKLFQRWSSKTVTGRILSEISIPAILAMGWAVVAWFHSKTPFESVSAGFTAFFFLFFLQGQFLRMRKNVRDDNNASKWDENFSSISEALEVIRRDQQSIRSRSSEKTRKVGATIKQDLPDYPGNIGADTIYFRQANAALQQKLYYPAMLSAAVAFEHALRMAASTLGLNRKANLGAILSALGAQAEASEIETELRALLRLRNGLRLALLEPYLRCPNILHLALKRFDQRTMFPLRQIGGSSVQIEVEASL